METAPPESNGPVIFMEDVAVGSMQDPAATSLTGVNWQVQPGEFWVLAGLQGEGKTDLLMMTAGLMAPLNGQYRLFGQEMPMFDEARLSQRLRLGLAFENGQLFNHLTVAENLALPLRYHWNLPDPEVHGAVQAMLEVMELGPWADSTPGALGRNWQKRAGLARALMLKPEVVLVDNPLSSLDLRHTYWWLSTLEQLAKPRNFLGESPLSFVVTTADLRPWLTLGRQFGILKDKHLVIVGDRARMQAAPTNLVGDLLGPGLRHD
jgi:ABC-type transporter Mla maintaining outer membrane lipid asymmetry ATPase subunit MlaF